jgi:hypothetical protein
MEVVTYNNIINFLIEIYKIITHIICVYYISDVLFTFCYDCIFRNYTNIYLIIYSVFKLYIGSCYNYNLKLSYFFDIIFYIVFIIDFYIFNNNIHNIEFLLFCVIGLLLIFYLIITIIMIRTN